MIHPIFTFKDLKDFLNSLPDEVLSQPAIIPQEEQAPLYIDGGYTLDEDWYYDTENPEDSGPISVVREWDEYNENRYEKCGNAGDPHLSTTAVKPELTSHQGESK
jgi:hypothetical protein